MSSVELVGYVKRGKNRKKVFLAISEPSIPSEIVIKIYGKPSNTYYNLVSRALSELKEKELVKLINPKEKTGRLYELTDKGMKVKELIVKYGKSKN